MEFRPPGNLLRASAPFPSPCTDPRHTLLAQASDLRDQTGTPLLSFSTRGSQRLNIPKNKLIPSCSSSFPCVPFPDAVPQQSPSCQPRPGSPPTLHISHTPPTTADLLTLSPTLPLPFTTPLSRPRNQSPRSLGRCPQTNRTHALRGPHASNCSEHPFRVHG